ncbi:hypothetical protein ACF05W_22325 [Streptomyces lydicus]|uniref:hypothetical protein n=1 Tax=Streptomyces lydicus TaxID=47763 RepID=UPI0037008349
MPGDAASGGLAGPRDAPGGDGGGEEEARTAEDHRGVQTRDEPAGDQGAEERDPRTLPICRAALKTAAAAPLRRTATRS